MIPFRNLMLIAVLALMAWFTVIGFAVTIMWVLR